MASQIRCDLCGDIITSKHRHDFNCCSCKNVCIDGGDDYQRVLFMSESYTVLAFPGQETATGTSQAQEEV